MKKSLIVQQEEKKNRENILKEKEKEHDLNIKKDLNEYIKEQNEITKNKKLDYVKYRDALDQQIIQKNDFITINNLNN